MVAAVFLALALTADIAPGEWKRDVRFDDLGEVKLDAELFRKFGWNWPTPTIRLASESFTVYVPRNKSAQGSYGLFVYVSPGSEGMMVSRHLGQADLEKLLDEHHLLYIGPNGVGNQRNISERLQLALTGVHNMKKQFEVDVGRVIIGGFSGGGKVACMAGRAAPRTFSGVLAIGGPEFHRKVFIDQRRFIPPGMQLSSAQERQVRQRVSFAFVSGPKDFNYNPTLLIEKAYKKAGFRTLMVDVPDLEHTIPGAEPLGEALAFLLEQAAQPETKRAKGGSRGEAKRG